MSCLSKSTAQEPIELRNIKIRNNNGDFNYATITIKQIESPDQRVWYLSFLRRNEIVQPHLPQKKNSKLPLSEKELESEAKKKIC
jgi:two-component system CheB/CheR fusion protein